MEGYDETTIMNHYLMGEGIPAEAIFTDSEGWNTYDTAKNTIRLMEANGYHSALLIAVLLYLKSQPCFSPLRRKEFLFSSCRFF